MRINLTFHINSNSHKGFSLIELVVFLVIISIASTALLATYSYSVRNSADPIIIVRALELGQAKLDEILALKYDANTPTGGIPACGSTGAGAQVCNNLTDADMNDVDDYNGVSDTPYAGYTRSVNVITTNNEKLITVSVAAPKSVTVKLAAYRANF